MRKRPILRNLLILGAAVLIFIGVVVARMVFQPGPMDFVGGNPVELAAYGGRSPVGVPVELQDASALVKGKYLTDAADCQACHTVKGGTPFAGGRAFKLPFGTIFTPNITPDAETGIGKWTDADFLNAVHKGISRDGSRLYPAFPYASYSLLTDADVLAIKAYLFTLRPVRSPAIPNTLAFPFNQRWLMSIWASMFNADRRFRPVPERSAEWNRGAYLVEGAAHCGECHSPRNLMMAVDNRSKFAGGSAEGWNAYNITSDRLAGVGAWSSQELAAYLAKGHAGGRGAASGPMAEAVDLSLSKLSPSDVAAMVLYLRSVPPIRGGATAVAPAANVSARVGPDGNPIGKRIFQEACASCHAWTGAGAIVDEARLTGSRAANDATAANVARMILSGNGTPGLSRPYMPSFKRAYTDAEVAAVANYVTARFGTKPSNVRPADVARMRDE